MEDLIMRYSMVSSANSPVLSAFDVIRKIVYIG